MVEKSEAELAAQTEKRKEQGKRLQEMQSKMREEKVSELLRGPAVVANANAQLAEKAAALEIYKSVLAERANLSPEAFLDHLYQSTDFDTPGELEAWVKKTEAEMKRKQRKDAGEEDVEEDPVFPLVDRPDDELTEDEIREKRRQRLMKAGWEARVKVREEKERERERVREEERREEEERVTDPEGWARKLRLQQEVSAAGEGGEGCGMWQAGRQAGMKRKELSGAEADEQTVIARIEMRKKQKTQKKDRKSAASQNRMKTIANLAAEDKVSKKRKKGDGE